MIRIHLITAGLALTLALVGLATYSAPACAKEYNQRKHLAPAQQAKIQGIIAWTTYMQANTESEYAQGDLRPCKELNIGSTPTDPHDPYNPNRTANPHTPEEQTIVTGDIYNIDGHCYAEPTPTGPGY